jgi:integrase
MSARFTRFGRRRRVRPTLASVVPYRTKSGERRYAVRWRQDGRQRWQSVPGPKRNAEKVKRDKEERMALGPLYEAEPQTLGDFLADWLERYKLRVKETTYARRVDALRALGVLAPTQTAPPAISLSARFLQQLGVVEVEDAVTILARRAPRQAQIALASLKMALRSAAHRGQRFDQGLLAIAPPRYGERTARFLTWAQVETLQSWFPEHVARIVPVAALTGAREGELFDLLESDLDLDASVMRIRTGKTAAAARSVDLPATAVTLLREQLLARRHTESFVFPAPMGGRWGASNFMARVFRKAAVAAGLGTLTLVDGKSHYEGLVFHDLRHTYVSLMGAAGVHPSTVAAQIGHADGGALLLRRYRHLFPQEAKRAAERLDALVREKDEEPTAGEAGA